MGQLIANLATLARGPNVEAIWDAEDDELLAAARSLVEHYRQRNTSVAEMSWIVVRKLARDTAFQEFDLSLPSQRTPVEWHA